ncbi:MAG: hypothetical protein Q9171_002641 [Xanthocarpia ochracea]
MSPPESEWMLWAMRLKTSVRADLDHEVQSIGRRCTKFEGTVTMLDALRDDVNSLTVSLEHLQHVNSALQDRILEVESESITQQRKFATESDILREAVRLLAQQLTDVAKDLDHTKRESKATEEKQQRDQQEWKQQIVGLMPKIDDEANKRMGGPLDLIALPRPKGRFADCTAGQETFSEATTTDDVPEEASDSPEGLYRPQQSDTSICQGKATYQEYLASGENYVRKVVQQSEAQAVKAYIQGMRQRFRRQPVWDALEANGWTWANARHEIQMIIDEGKRRRQKRRTIQLSPLWKFD